MSVKEIVRYSESFKLKIVKELELGKLSGITEAREQYGIAGAGTVQCWLRKYGKNHLLNKVVRVEKADEKREIKKLNDKIRKLESALSDAHIDLIIEKEYFKMACEAAGIDNSEEFKKKHDIH